MDKPKLPSNISMPKDTDTAALYLFAVLFLVSAVAALAAAGLSDRISSYDVFPLLSLPFAVLGIVSYLFRRRWIPFIVIAVVCVLLYLLSPAWGYLSLFVLVCTRGIAVMSAILQKRLMGSLLLKTQRSTVRQKTRPSDRLAQFLFGIPGNVDTRIMSMDSAVRRRSLPWAEILGTMRIALVPSLVMWTALFSLAVYHFNFSQAYVAVFTVGVYIAMAALPWIILRTLDVRVGSEGGGMRLYDGLLGTATRMTVPLVLMLVIVALALYSGYEAFMYILASAVVTAVSVLVASAIYYFEYEKDVVATVQGARDGFVPVDREGPGPHRLDDGIPGTPRRKEDSCFDQKY